jgi:hypothetical protein
MYKKYFQEINEKLAKTGKAIISIGDSFVQGQGSLDEEIYRDNKVSTPRIGTPVHLMGDGDLPASEEDTINFAKKCGFEYTVAQTHYGAPVNVNFEPMEYRNTFNKILCDHYLNGEYASINLGQSGKGNLASFMDLLFLPEIDWHLIKQAIVIYVPTSPDRYDWVADTFNDHHHYNTFWPHGLHGGPKESIRGLISTGYGDLYTHKMAALHQIGIVQQILLWCKAYNAELIITPGFCHREYEYDFMHESLSKNIQRDSNLVAQDDGFHVQSEDVEKLINLWPWDKMFKPEGCTSFMGLAMKQENIREDRKWFFDFIKTGSPNYWITPCAHPGKKAHDLFAKRLYEYAIEKNMLT